MTDGQYLEVENARVYLQRFAYSAAPLLLLALTHCGGREINGHPAVGGEESSATTTAAGDSNAGGSAGLTDWSFGGDLVVPVGGASATSQCIPPNIRSGSAISSIIRDNPPTPAGGSIRNGLYYLTQRQDFVGPDGNTRTPDDVTGALMISNSNGVTADLQMSWMEIKGELPLPIEQTQTLIVSGSSYRYTVICTNSFGSASPGSVSFTASPDRLIWFTPIAGATRVEFFTRQW